MEEVDSRNSDLQADDVRLIFYHHLFNPLTFHQWCALCCDGHDTLVICDACYAVNCGCCIPQLDDIPPEELKELSYHCVGCTSTSPQKKTTIFQVCDSTPLVVLT